MVLEASTGPWHNTEIPGQLCTLDPSYCQGRELPCAHVFQLHLLPAPRSHNYMFVGSEN